MSILRSIVGPKYDGKYLKSLIKEKLGGTWLHETLTSVVIPTFDIKSLQPTIFSTYEVALALSLWLYPFGPRFNRVWVVAAQLMGKGCSSRLILTAMVFRSN